MSDGLLLGERLLALLEASQRVSTYKPALLLALTDAATEVPDDRVPVRFLAERVIESYWRQTVVHGESGRVLLQNQGTQAKVITAILQFRVSHNAHSRGGLSALKRGPAWDELLEAVELSLAEMPIPRLQQPFEPFLYAFGWPWHDDGGWRKRDYLAGSREIILLPGVRPALVSLAPLLRPFVLRWWLDKAAQLNARDVRDAQALVAFEEFLFGQDRASLARVARDLEDLQSGACFYCDNRLTKIAVDHVVPWSFSGDDGIENLVAACPRCNSAKSATLSGAAHIADLLARNDRWSADLEIIATTKTWARDPVRTTATLRSTYMSCPAERPLWYFDRAAGGPIVFPAREELERLHELVA